MATMMKLPDGSGFATGTVGKGPMAPRATFVKGKGKPRPRKRVKKQPAPKKPMPGGMLDGY